MTSMPYLLNVQDVINLLYYDKYAILVKCSRRDKLTIL